MKKLLVLLGLMVITTTAGYSAPCQKCGMMPPPNMTPQERQQKEQAFEQRLGLTEDQKQKAKTMREAGFEKIKPVIDTLRAKEQEFDTVKNSDLSAQEKENKMNGLKTEIQALRKQAHEIKRENMKEFESILTPEQQKILKEMKQEGRDNYHKNHPPRNFVRK